MKPGNTATSPPPLAGVTLGLAAEAPALAPLSINANEHTHEATAIITRQTRVRTYIVPPCDARRCLNPAPFATRYLDDRSRYRAQDLREAMGKLDEWRPKPIDFLQLRQIVPS